MDLYPITLGTGRPLPSKARTGQTKQARASSDTAGSSAALSDPVPADLKKEILKRDDNVCGCCGFKSDKYQQIHFKDHDQTNLEPDNLITACIFCHQCFNLSTVGSMQSGMLIWLPEIEQHVLNNMARAIYIARISQGPIADTSRKILDMLMARREEAARRITTDDPSILATIMSDYLSLKQYSGRSKKLDGIRLFPLDRRSLKETDITFNQFPQILAYWRSKNGPFGTMPPQKWIDLYQDMLARAA